MKRQIKLILTLLCVMVLSFQLQIATLAAEPAETTVAVNTETAELPTNITKEAAAEIKDGEDPVKGIAVTEVWYKLTTGSKAYYTVELENSCKLRSEFTFRHIFILVSFSCFIIHLVGQFVNNRLTFAQRLC